MGHKRWCRRWRYDVLRHDRHVKSVWLRERHLAWVGLTSGSVAWLVVIRPTSTATLLVLVRWSRVAPADLLHLLTTFPQV